MLVAPAMDLVAVSVDGKDQHHDAAHDPSSHRAHWGALNHVQCDHLITNGSHVINVGTFGSHDPSKAFFLGRTVGFVQVCLSVTVHHAPLAVQHPKTVPTLHPLVTSTVDTLVQGILQARIDSCVCHWLLVDLTARVSVLCIGEVASTLIDLQGALTRTFTFILLHSVAVETETVHHAASTEGKRVAGLIDDADKRVGSWDPCQAVFRTVAAMYKVRQIPHQASVELVRSLHCPVTEAIAQVLLHKVGMVQDIICYQGLLVGDVLLLQRCMTFGVNEGWMSYQITSVLHYEAPYLVAAILVTNW